MIYSGEITDEVRAWVFSQFPGAVVPKDYIYGTWQTDDVTGEIKGVCGLRLEDNGDMTHGIWCKNLHSWMTKEFKRQFYVLNFEIVGGDRVITTVPLEERKFIYFIDEWTSELPGTKIYDDMSRGRNNTGVRVYSLTKEDYFKAKDEGIWLPE